MKTNFIEQEIPNENVNVIEDENKEVRKSQEKSLRRWNLICCILHALQAVVILFLGIYSDSSKFKLPMTTVFLNWENNMPKQELVVRGFIKFAAVSSSFSWLSAAAHLSVLIFFKTCYYDVTRNFGPRRSWDVLGGPRRF